MVSSILSFSLESNAHRHHALHKVARECSGLHLDILEGIEVGLLCTIEQRCIGIEDITTIAYATGKVLRRTDIAIRRIGLHRVDGNPRRV